MTEFIERDTAAYSGSASFATTVQALAGQAFAISLADRVRRAYAANIAA